MSSSSTASAAPSSSSDVSHSTSGSSTLIATRFIPYIPPSDPHAGAPTIKVTAKEPLSPQHTRDPHAQPKRKSKDPLTRRNTKKRRVSPPQEAPTRPSSAVSSPAPSGSSSYASPAPTHLSAVRLGRFTHDTRHAFSAPSARSSVGPQPGPPRECWLDEDGKPGAGFLSSEAVVRGLMKGYKAYFKNPDDPNDRSFEPHPTDYPVVELEYPNTNASERFALLAPKDPDHYNPIICLESTLHTIIEHYLTPAQQSMFGTLPDTAVTDDDSSDDEFPPPPSDAPSPPLSHVSTPSSDTSECSSLSSHSSLSLFSNCSISSASSLSSICALSSYAQSASPISPPSIDYLRLLQRAIRKEDGPLFIKVITAINALLALLKYPPLPIDPFQPVSTNKILGMVRTWPRIPSPVVQRIVEEAYQRAVGPNVDMLRRYEAFSSEVYGELMPTFVTDVFRATGLTQDSLFLDLGSGVGNVVLQASLETGCRSYGIELMPGPAELAKSQLEQFKMRCKMWGVRMGDVELEYGNMLESRRVDQLVREADVVLVNNKVFLEPLNEALRQKFLDLKEGAIVVSLKCLMGSVRSTARERSSSPALKERNADDIGEIFTVTARPYFPGSVSWGGGGGEYFLQRMNREDYARRKLQFENSRAGTGRVTRSRR